MTEWRPRDGIASLPPLTRAVHAVVMRKLLESNERALQLQSVTIACTSDGECISFAFTFECPGGLKVEIEYFDALCRQMLYDSDEAEVEWAGELIDQSISYLTNNSLKEIEDKVHEDRVKMRIRLEEWHHKDLVYSHLASSWIRFSDSPFGALCEHYFELYAPNGPTRNISISSGLDLFEPNDDHDFRYMLDHLRNRFNGLSATSANGADGRVDLLALRALEAIGPGEPGLRQWTCLTARPPYSNRFKCRNGHISLEDNFISSSIACLVRNSIDIHGLTLPYSVLAGCKGRPIIEFVDHPYFCDRMVITGAAVFEGPDSNGICFDIDQPVYYFCSLSGRYWSDTSIR